MGSKNTVELKYTGFVICVGEQIKCLKFCHTNYNYILFGELRESSHENI